MAKAMLIDTDQCLACNACTVECKRNNMVPVGQGIAWTRIEKTELGAYPNVQAQFLKRACNHCTEAVCIEVCPVGAISKPDGVHVVNDKDKCISCGRCVDNCPFGVPHFGEPRGAAQKCLFCYGARAEDQPTACAAACPFGAITFGDRDTLIEQGRQRVAQLQQKGKANAVLYGQQEQGGLNVLYVLTDSPSPMGVPLELPVTGGVLFQLPLTLTAAGLALAAAGTYLRRRVEEVSESN